MRLPHLFKEHLKNQEDEGELKPLKDFWTDKNLDDGEKFLRDYILNKKFLENNSENDEDEDDENLSDDEKTLEKQEEFEHKYNFRLVLIKYISDILVSYICISIISINTIKSVR